MELRQEWFREPIIQAIAELGGSAQRKEVLKRVSTLMRLDPEDRKKSGSGTGWEKHIDFNVLQMRGDLIKNTCEVEKGGWELTAKGQSLAWKKGYKSKTNS